MSQTPFNQQSRTMDSLRFLFITPEFPTNKKCAGGLSNFLLKFTALLAEAGHDVEILTPGDTNSTIITDTGVEVHSIKLSESPYALKIALRIARKLGKEISDAPLQLQKKIGSRANELLSSRDYDVIQYCDHMAIGRYLKSKPTSLTICRCSSAVDLYALADNPDARLDKHSLSTVERTILKADIAIAPSKIIAAHISSKLNKHVYVSRPPALLSLDVSEIEPIKWLPHKYFFHYAGWLSRKKGTHLVLSALKEALTTHPDIIMILAGGINFDTLELSFDWHTLLPNLLMLPPQEPKHLYSLVQSSHAVLLPSLIDNLPNTAIESKILGKKIITLSQNSIDELVSLDADIILKDRTPAAMAEALIRVWTAGKDITAESSPTEKAVRDIRDEFKPSISVQNYIELVRESIRLKQVQSSSPSNI